LRKRAGRRVRRRTGFHVSPHHHPARYVPFFRSPVWGAVSADTLEPDAGDRRHRTRQRMRMARRRLRLANSRESPALSGHSPCASLIPAGARLRSAGRPHTEGTERGFPFVLSPGHSRHLVYGGGQWQTHATIYEARGGWRQNLVIAWRYAVWRVCFWSGHSQGATNLTYLSGVPPCMSTTIGVDPLDLSRCVAHVQCRCFHLRHRLGADG